MEIKAIQTWYKGVKFRSRLEARWAVFFDEMGIDWEYEEQGYELESRIWHNGRVHKYLPDFSFPGSGLLGEVKGYMSYEDLWRLVDCASALSAPRGGCGDGKDMVVFGRIPDPDSDCMPTLLHMHKGDLLGSAWWGTRECGGEIVATDAGDWGKYTATQVRKWLINGSYTAYPGWRPDEWRDDLKRFKQGFLAARSARFEHGQSGSIL